MNRNKIQIFYLLSVILMLFIMTVLKGEVKSEVYKEKVHINIGRDSYIAGETIWFKAYCFSNLEGSLKGYSKVLYVELVDYRSRHILGQILNIEDGKSNSYIQIPDTLSSGLYFIKGYTNWMKNFDDKKFFSAPVFIYNNYDEDNSSEILEYNIQPQPDIYIQGGRLINNIPAKISIHIPGLFGHEITGRLVETPSQDSVSRIIRFDPSGIASFDLMPMRGTEYRIVCEDSMKAFFSIDLPEVEYSGYSVKAIRAENQNLILQVDASSTSGKQVHLVVKQRTEIYYEADIENSRFGQDIKVPLPGNANSRFDIKLEDMKGNLLAEQSLIHSSNGPVGISSFREEVKTNEENTFELSFHGMGNVNSGNFSIDVYKNEPSNKSCGNDLIFSDFENKYITEQVDVALYAIYPATSAGSPAGRIKNSLPANNIKYPVEDMGILFSGKILSRSGESIPNEMEVILSIKDTLPHMHSSISDSEGRFVFLIDKYKSMEGYIDLYKGKDRLTNKFDLQLENKFYYSSNGKNSEFFTQFSGPEFSHDIRDESQRMIIQRAFGNLDHNRFDSLINVAYAQQPFYGDPTLVVYPDEFFFLPNFNEIIREIVPRVRFKKTKLDCELIVSHIENLTKSYTPLVILDGLPVFNICDLQLLNSDHVQRIEVQSGLRLVGNYLYDGLVAVYTTNDYKSKKDKRDERNTFNVPGYAYPAVISYHPKGVNHKEEKHPDFKNHLYWDPDLTLNTGEKAEVEFFTSDESGGYVVEISGFSEDGTPLHLKETFFVAQ